ncbi:MAG TPA: PilZ domain-containing protein [Kofleriaceae bacterium]|nr:PilZ domain-containing protein [Kofleriaceae bacterium]
MDKREAVRVPVRVRARCRCSGIVIDGLVEDVSRSGLFMRAPKWIRPGSSAEIEVDLPGEAPLQLEVCVVRVEHSSQRAGMGLRFVERPESSRPLANFIMRQHAESSS